MLPQVSAAMRFINLCAFVHRRGLPATHGRVYSKQTSTPLYVLVGVAAHVHNL